MGKLLFAVFKGHPVHISARDTACRRLSRPICGLIEAALSCLIAPDAAGSCRALADLIVTSSSGLQAPAWASSERQACETGAPKWAEVEDRK